MALQAFREWDRLKNALFYEGKQNQKVLLRFLKDLDKAAYTGIITHHIKRFGRKRCIFETMYDDTDTQRVLGMNFAQAYYALSLGDMEYKFTTDDLRGCVCGITVQEYHNNRLSAFLGRRGEPKIVIAVSYRGQP